MKVIMLYNYFAIIMKKKIQKMGITPPTNYLSQTPFLHEFCTLTTTLFFHIFFYIYIYNENKLLIKQCITNKDKNRNNKTDKIHWSNLRWKRVFQWRFWKAAKAVDKFELSWGFQPQPNAFSCSVALMGPIEPENFALNLINQTINN